MSKKSILIALIAFLIVDIAPSAMAETASTGPAQGVTSPGAALTKKQIRAENRAQVRLVRKSLSQVRGFAVDRITVLASNGVVTLTGEALDQNQIDAAVAAAGNTHGVVDVQNRLRIAERGH
ncbi:BON domain-containing protein [Paraburkholderia sp. SIMBA_054]|uniref:BON domain-containing protein n=1 Tax=Paraburkholderia sp. SIMBA_054 TaxID=3085795 RepID=UPI00397B92C5